MAIYRSIKTLISQSRKFTTTNNSRSLFSLSSSISTSPIPITRRHPFLSQSVGPLFLSNPPWKLSQSATPLLLQSDVVSNFLKLNIRPLPPELRYYYNAPPPPKDADVEESVVINDVASISDSYFNPPNLISFARLLSGPFIGWMIVNDMYSSAFVALAISGASDWLDGYVARMMKIDSVVGSYLDPLADKVLIGCVAVAMVENGLLHPGLVALVVLRDVGLVGGALYKRASSLNWKWNSWRDFVNLDGAQAQKVEPLYISKINTVFQLALVAAALLQPVFGSEETQLYINYLSWLVASTTVASTAAYGVQHLGSGAALMKKSKFGT